MRNFKLRLPKKLFTSTTGGPTVDLEVVMSDIAQTQSEVGGIYAADGTLDSNRTVTGGSHSLTFTGLTTHSETGSGHNTRTTTGTGDVKDIAGRNYLVTAGNEASITASGRILLESTATNVSLVGDTGVNLTSGSTITIESFDAFSLSFGDATGPTTGIIEDRSEDAAGLQYSADYSTNYTNRSLVDKAYVSSSMPTTGYKLGTSDADGLVTVTHGRGSTPTTVVATASGTTCQILTVTSIGASTFTVKAFDAAGNPINAGTVNFYWFAK